MRLDRWDVLIFIMVISIAFYYTYDSILYEKEVLEDVEHELSSELR